MLVTAVCGKTHGPCLNQSDQFHAGARKHVRRPPPWESSPGHAQEARGCCLVTTRQPAGPLAICAAVCTGGGKRAAPNKTPGVPGTGRLFHALCLILTTTCKAHVLPLESRRKSSLRHTFTHSFSSCFLGAACVPCTGWNVVLSSQGRQHRRRSQVHKGDNYSVGQTPWRHCRLSCQGKGRWSWDLWEGNGPAPGPLHLLCLLPAVLLLLSRRTTVWRSGLSFCSPSVTLGKPLS